MDNPDLNKNGMPSDPGALERHRNADNTEKGKADESEKQNQACGGEAVAEIVRSEKSNEADEILHKSQKAQIGNTARDESTYAFRWDFDVKRADRKKRAKRSRRIDVIIYTTIVTLAFVICIAAAVLSDNGKNNDSPADSLDVTETLQP